MPNKVEKDRRTGKQGRFVLSDAEADLKGAIPFTSWELDVTRTFQDRTSTTQYSATYETIFPAWVPVSTSGAAHVKGRYRTSSTPAFLVAELFQNDRPVRVQFDIGPNDPYMDFYAWIEKLVMTVEAEGIVNFSCDLRSEGEITELSDLAAPLPPGPIGDLGEVDPEDGLLA